MQEDSLLIYVGVTHFQQLNSFVMISKSRTVQELFDDKVIMLESILNDVINGCPDATVFDIKSVPVSKMYGKPVGHTDLIKFIQMKKGVI